MWIYLFKVFVELGNSCYALTMSSSCLSLVFRPTKQRTSGTEAIQETSPVTPLQLKAKQVVMKMSTVVHDPYQIFVLSLIKILVYWNFVPFILLFPAIDSSLEAFNCFVFFKLL